MEEKIKKIICSILDRNIAIENGEDIRVYGMDSLLKVQLVIGIENEYNIEFADEDLDQKSFTTIDEICQLINKYKK
jgi:acyl carrier protein